MIAIERLSWKGYAVGRRFTEVIRMHSSCNALPSFKLLCRELETTPKERVFAPAKNTFISSRVVHGRWLHPCVDVGQPRAPSWRLGHLQYFSTRLQVALNLNLGSLIKGHSKVLHQLRLLEASLVVSFVNLNALILQTSVQVSTFGFSAMVGLRVLLL